jgi:hypothetical protein
MAARTRANGEPAIALDLQDPYVGGWRGGDSRNEDGRLGEFAHLAESKVANQFHEENMHVAQ